ncbi:hypothetical protein BDV39DRAFT_135786 [Aspergillus sergii]|uniref:Uncharacterized protein n=1 Tax=Aspergillus sergii TaxID=1034303 RepID=A0A5N6XK90_9EURO|nr:hypothetical protein BDV39DRAFT_135786 [Aspergillus sergii]
MVIRFMITPVTICTSMTIVAAMIECLGHRIPTSSKPSQAGVGHHLQMGRLWYGQWSLTAPSMSVPPVSVVTHSNRFADILTRFVHCSCPLLLWSGAITMIFLYRVIQKSVYLTNPCDNDPVIGGRPSVIITTEYVAARRCPSVYHCDSDSQARDTPQLISTGLSQEPTRRKTSGCIRTKKGPTRRSRVAWRGVVSSSIVILYADIASTERERKRDSQDLVALSGLILNGSGCLLVVNLHATRPLRRVFFGLGLQPASHT